MANEIVAFSVFMLACSAFLIGLMLQYARRVHRLRRMVAAMSPVNEMAAQVAARRKTR